MKVTAEHLEILRTAIAPLDTEPTRQAYRERRFPRAHLVRDLDTRYMWDLFYGAKAYNLLPVMENEYTNKHIETALKRIVAPL